VESNASSAVPHLLLHSKTMDQAFSGEAREFSNFETDIAPQLSSDVNKVYLGRHARLAVKVDDTVISLDHQQYGGEMSPEVVSALQSGMIKQVHASDCAFSVLMAKSPESNPTASSTVHPSTLAPTPAAIAVTEVPTTSSASPTTSSTTIPNTSA
jgi:hypothetical protein